MAGLIPELGGAEWNFFRSLSLVAKTKFTMQIKHPHGRLNWLFYAQSPWAAAREQTASIRPPVPFQAQQGKGEKIRNTPESWKVKNPGPSHKWNQKWSPPPPLRRKRRQQQITQFINVCKCTETMGSLAIIDWGRKSSASLKFKAPTLREWLFLYFKSGDAQMRSQSGPVIYPAGGNTNKTLLETGSISRWSREIGRLLIKFGVLNNISLPPKAALIWKFDCFTWRPWHLGIIVQ
jgi:hypothetical protein